MHKHKKGITQQEIRYLVLLGETQKDLATTLALKASILTEAERPALGFKTLAP